jgi:hypothetical protein|tara:strand:+ start:1825 stop:2280 length:456 start_codon:yes stop_codon:yes gene_type:complete
MADTKVSNLTELTKADSNDVFYIVDTGSSLSKKITFDNLLKGPDSTGAIKFPAVISEVQSLTTDFHAISSAVNAVTAYRDTEISFLSTQLNVLSGEFDVTKESLAFPTQIINSLSSVCSIDALGTRASPVVVNLGSTTTMTFVSGILIGTT